MTVEELFVNQYLALLQAKDELENEISNLREKLETSEAMTKQIRQELNDFIDALIVLPSNCVKLEIDKWGTAFLNARYVTDKFVSVYNRRIDEKLKEKKEND